jgi:hypothetical protein
MEPEEEMKIMPTVDVRKYGETMRDQSRTSVEEIRKLIRAWVGATDYAYERVRTELKDLQTRNRAQVERVRTELKDLQTRNRAQVERLQERAKKLNRDDVRKQMRATYEDLAERGDKVIQELRTRPQARLVFTRAAAHRAEEKAESAEHRVTGQAPKGGRKPAAHKAPASK